MYLPGTTQSTVVCSPKQDVRDKPYCLAQAEHISEEAKARKLTVYVPPETSKAVDHGPVSSMHSPGSSTVVSTPALIPLGSKLTNIQESFIENPLKRILEGSMCIKLG